MQAHPSIDLDQGVGGGEGASMLEAAARPEPEANIMFDDASHAVHYVDVT